MIESPTVMRAGSSSGRDPEDDLHAPAVWLSLPADMVAISVRPGTPCPRSDRSGGNAARHRRLAEPDLLTMPQFSPCGCRGPTSIALTTRAF
jgi:hypothetical protein